ncbi:hypothetical protein BaRGS_00023274, partial [Batillaria attramentaria]
CGTMVPIWLNGTHPTEAEGVVSKTACANFHTSVPGATTCCQQKVTVGVLNCGSFYVYFLVPTPSCPMAYCAGTRAPCPSGQWSPTGFADSGCRPTFPRITTHPVLSGPELPDGHSFRFRCDVQYPHQDPEQRLEVAWTFNNVVNSSFTQVLQDPGRRAYLDGSALNGHMGEDVRCQVRSFYDGNSAHPSPWLKSNPFQATVTIDPPTITISEAEEERNITVRSTVPIVCDSGFNFGPNDCCIRLRLNIRGQDSHGHAIRSEYDFRQFQELGDYTAFYNPTRNFEVQIRTYPYRNGVSYGTCVCAIAIREGNDLVRIDACNEYWSRGSRYPSPTALIPRKLGDRTKVYLPSGAELQVSASTYGLDTTITIPGIDRGNGRGLCGTFDGNSRNEHTTRDGRVLSSSRSAEFVMSWKNDYRRSLFRNKPPIVKDTSEVDYCQCDDRTSHTGHYINCTSRGDIDGPLLPCYGCVPVPTPTPARCFVDHVGQQICSDWSDRSRRSSDPEWVDYDEDLLPLYDPDEHQDLTPTSSPTWPTPSGITEEQAEDHCTKSLQKSSLWQNLQTTSPGRVDRLLSDCKSDIQLTDSLGFLESYTKVATTSAQVELAKDPSNFVTNLEGQVVLKPEVTTDLCDPSCLENNGVRCDRGRCVCKPGFTGVNCQLDAHQGPQLSLIGGFQYELVCVSVAVDKGVRVPLQSLFGRPDGSISSDSSIEPAEFINNRKLACQFPDAKVKSATMDGSLYGNEVRMTVFDSSCQKCNGSECQQLADTCLINNLCYQDGTLNPSDNTLKCSVAESVSQWSSALKYPKIDSVTLAAESSSLKCTVQSARANSTAVFQVMWMYDGNDLRSSPLTMSSLHVATYNLNDLPGHSTGEVACKVRSYYDSSIIGPYVRSNIVDLA